MLATLSDKNKILRLKCNKKIKSIKKLKDKDNNIIINYKSKRLNGIKLF
jgi:hypothetical protein